MNWIEAANRMDRAVIKKDGTSTDSDYFMATHVPFKDLEVLGDGSTSSVPIHLSEEQIYDRYIVNRANRHQMIIVRGTNGTGKSHLICWLHNRFQNDKDNYDPAREKIIFLRRLGNTIRGAIQQMIDEGIVTDPDLQEKFRKFINAAESQDEAEFKTTIYNAYASRVLTDKTGKTYTPIVCRNISSFLHDQRIQEYMMRDDGPVTRCYRMINSGANSIVSGDTIFTESDFNFPKDLATKIKREAAEEVRGLYLDDLRDDTVAIKKLTAYLNHFTSAVIQSCANISSESARDLFVNLRRSLKSQGKNLTLFIEDFTSFSIVESELITALAVENGGEYKDLCRVTSVIGITDGYYTSFRDNFKDRVSSQINVTEQSFGDEKFLLEMAGRYLNAIYCEPSAIQEWYIHGGKQTDLPCSGFAPAYNWDHTEIANKTFTLYPFNKRSILDMYARLKNKTPRYFLTYVLQQPFVQFADGMGYGDTWHFPLLPSAIASKSMNTTFASSVEGSSLSDTDKQRLKVLLATWGDGTSRADDDMLGGIPCKFLEEIGLQSFSGLHISPVHPSDEPSTVSEEQPQVSPSNHEFKPSVDHIVSREENLFRSYVEYLNDWLEEKKTLNGWQDFRKWLRNFVVNTIPWQDEGIPVYFVSQRLNSGDFVSIEGENTADVSNYAVVVVKRSSETRDVLFALLLYNRYKGWAFQDAPYYQSILISWLEKNKQQIKNNVCGKCIGNADQPLLAWCMATVYLRGLLYGEQYDESKPLSLFRKLVDTQRDYSVLPTRGNQDWNDALVGMRHESSSILQVQELLNMGSTAAMGVLGAGTVGYTGYYRTIELIHILDHLKENSWDIRSELPMSEDARSFALVVSQLKGTYGKIDRIILSEKARAERSVQRLEKVVGQKPTRENLIELSNAIQSFYQDCNAAHESYHTELKIFFDGEPIDFARKVMESYSHVCACIKATNSIALLKLFSSDPIKVLDEITDNLISVEALATKLRDKHRGLVKAVSPVDTKIVDAALSELEALSERIKEVAI